jgi:hypothetical protein
MSFLGPLKKLWMKLLAPISRRLDSLENQISAARQESIAHLLVARRRLELLEYSSAERLMRIQESLGRIEARQLENPGPGVLADYEFRVFSQWGEDGIIQHLLKCVDVDKDIFVEFGVSDYLESNTRFLLVNNNWTGLVLDSSEEFIGKLRRSAISWQHNLIAVQAFVTRDNINELIAARGINGDIGLLSIDIDGNDYWVWEAMDVVKPVIVIIEYNHRFGSELAVTIPYDEKFRRGENYPLIYFGASLAALCRLASRKGYAFVGCNRNGVNAFFVRREKMPDSLRELAVSEGYVAGKFSETRDAEGNFIPASPEEETGLLLSLPLVDVTNEAWRPGHKAADK